MIRTLIADVVDLQPAQLGEGPTWDGVNARLLWVDIFAGLVHAADAAGARQQTWSIGRHVSAALPTTTADILITAREGFAVLGADGTVSPLVDVLGERSEIRFNDAKCDPAGRAIGGTMAYDSTPGVGALYRLDPGPSAGIPSAGIPSAGMPVAGMPVATEILGGRTVSNGMGWNATGDRMYYIDSPERRITTFGYDTGSDAPLAAPLSTIDIPVGDGDPDGMCVDDDGGLWVALWDGGEVRRYTPAGVLDSVVQLPVSRPTSCAFGGPAGDTLFITSASRGLSDEELAAQPYAGCVFAVSPGITGRPATPWAPIVGATSAA